MILNYLCIFLFFFRLLDRRLQSSKVHRSCGVDKKVHFFSECTRCELKHIISFWCVIYHFGVVFYYYNTSSVSHLPIPVNTNYYACMRVCLRYIHVLIHITSTLCTKTVNYKHIILYLVSKHLEVFYPLNQVLLIARCLQMVHFQVIPKLCRLEMTKILCSPVNLIHCKVTFDRFVRRLPFLMILLRFLDSCSGCLCCPIFWYTARI